MSASELLALAERCEAATGPDRELDAEIGQACGRAIPAHKLAHGHLMHQPEWVGGASSSAHFLPFFTASLDAAMTLVPEGSIWSVDAYPDHSEATIREPYYDGEEYRAATPALALTAAALRARAESNSI